MLSNIWNLILVTPILNILVILYSLVGNMGVSIILLTLLIRALLIPIVLPSMKSMKKQRDLQPELDKLKKKFKHDKQKMAEAQMKLFKEHGINPASGCITQISMIVVLIALYNVIRQFSGVIDLNAINDLIYFAGLKFSESASINTTFGYLDLGQPDKFFIVPLLAGALQFLVSKMMQPYVEAGEKAAKQTPDKADDLAYNMQQQMMYLMPIMTVMIAAKLPSGVSLYILTTTLFSVVQQYFVSGWGGLKPLISKLTLSAHK